MITTGKRHGFLVRYDVGFDAGGRILAVDYTLAGQCGNSPDLSDAIVDRAMFHCDNAYYLPDVAIDGLRCKTHTVSNTAFRGFGGPQGMMAAETVIDEIAFATGPRPARRAADELLRQRRARSHALPSEGHHLHRAAHRRVAVGECALRGTADGDRRLQRREPGAEEGHRADAGEVRHLVHGQAPQTRQAPSCTSTTTAPCRSTTAAPRWVRGCSSRCASSSPGELGMALERVAATATRTDKVPNTSATAASSGTDLNGMAALLAARALRERLADFLAARHGVMASDIAFADDRVVVPGTRSGSGANGASAEEEGARELGYTWPELARAAYLERVPLSTSGHYATPKIHYNRERARGRPFYYFANGAAVSEVMIDTLTGETRILATDILHDVGSSVNPAIDLGQIEGGFVQGAGWLTHEELRWDERGRLLTDGPATYKIPTVGDMPARFDVAILDDSPNDEATVFRSKAVGGAAADARDLGVRRHPRRRRLARRSPPVPRVARAGDARGSAQIVHGTARARQDGARRRRRGRAGTRPPTARHRPRPTRCRPAPRRGGERLARRTGASRP